MNTPHLTNERAMMKNTLKITVSVIGMMSLSLGIVGILSSLLFLVSCGGGEEEDDPAASVSANPLADDPAAKWIVVSTTSPLTDKTLNESVVTITLNNGTWEDFRSDIGEALTVSGIDGVRIGTFGPAWFGVDRVTDTVIEVELGLDGNIDADGTLTFKVGSDAIEDYDGAALTASIPVIIDKTPPEPASPNPTPNPQPGGQMPQPPNQQQPEPPPQPEPPRLPEPPLNDLGACAAGMTLKPGESCSYVAGKANVVFSVRQDGSACREGGPVEKVEEIFGAKVNVNIENQTSVGITT